MKTICTLLLCILGLTGWSQEKEKLSFNWTKGETYTQTIEVSGVIAQAFSGQQMRLDMKVHIEIATLVKEKNAEGYELEMVYKNLSSSMSSPYGEVTVSADGGGPGSEVLAALQNKPFQAKMDMQGNFTEFNGMDKVLESLAGVEPSVIEQFKSNFGPESMKQNFQLGVVLPKEPVAVGDTWTHEFTQNVIVPQKISTTFTYLGSEDGCWKIGSNAVIDMSGGTIEMGGMKMESNMKGSISGELLVNKSNGLVKTGQMAVVFKGDNLMKANDRIPQDISINMDFQGKTTVVGTVMK
ncbi:MAG: DUF6263 family protein [Odoribacteraceae bacterium]|jgi:hypothetical protein|nr:DUF6263 family protein [Odoribacteraceae bacterium]